MAQALYRKYRSKSLDEVVGQDHITKTLALALKNGKVSHAYLFTGPRGVGKTSIARIMAREVNKLPYDEDSRHLDIIEIDAASNRRIDDIRDLREKVHIAPASAPYKVYIIDEVHMLTGESFNALLKTLEEPPRHAIFILATTEVQKLPATIISRAQRFHFRPIARDTAIEHLKSIAKKEGIVISDAALGLIAERGEGSFRDSISLLDQLASMSDGPIDETFVEQVLGLAPETMITSLLAAVEAGDATALGELLQQLDAQGVAPAILSDQLISRIMKDPALSVVLADMVDELLSVPKSSQPRTKLHITLLKRIASTHAPAPKTKKPAAVAAPAPIVLKKAVPKDIQKKPAPPSASAKPEPEVTPLAADTAAPLGSGIEFAEADWPKVLGILQKSNPPVFSVLKRARISRSNDLLKLTFGFKLHQKKMDDQKYRAILVSAVTSLGIACPRIETGVGNVDGVDFIAEAPKEQPLDATSASVLAMMGGGEAVNA